MDIPLFEVCLQSPDDAVAAKAGGARRVELCAALVEGGITPSLGSVLACRKAIDIDIMVMIRPRGGDFLYTKQEFETMKRDITALKSTGITGFVFGLITAEGDIDKVRTRELIELARPLSVTVHRVFDVCRDPFAALEDLIALGVDRVLTSGQAATVPQGIDLIKKLVQRAEGRIGILPGCGITPENVKEIIRETGVSEFHATAFTKQVSLVTHQNPAVYMGTPGLPEYEREVTSATEVGRFLAPFTAV